MEIQGRPDIKKLMDCEDIEGLVKALGYQNDWEIREEAARALGYIADPRTLKPLIAALKDENWRVRFTTAWALGSISNRSRISSIIENAVATHRDNNPDACVDIDEEARKAADSAVEPLIAALADEEAHVRCAAAKALGYIGDPRAVEPLTAVLKDSDEKVRKNAAETLKTFGL